MNAALRILAIIIAYMSVVMMCMANDIDNWKLTGSTFNIEFEVYPIDADTVCGIPRGEKELMILKNNGGKLSLTLQHIVGMKEIIVDRDGLDFIEYQGGRVTSNKEWILSLSFKSKKSSKGFTHTFFTGTASANGKVEPCTLEIVANGNDPNKEVFNFDDDEPATVYLDSYTIQVGDRKWGSMISCDLFSPDTYRLKKIQDGLYNYLMGKNKKHSKVNSISKPPLKK